MSRQRNLTIPLSPELEKAALIRIRNSLNSRNNKSKEDSDTFNFILQTVQLAIDDLNQKSVTEIPQYLLLSETFDYVRDGLYERLTNFVTNYDSSQDDEKIYDMDKYEIIRLLPYLLENPSESQINQENAISKVVQDNLSLDGHIESYLKGYHAILKEGEKAFEAKDLVNYFKIYALDTLLYQYEKLIKEDQKKVILEHLNALRDQLMEIDGEIYEEIDREIMMDGSVYGHYRAIISNILRVTSLEMKDILVAQLNHRLVVLNENNEKGKAEFTKQLIGHLNTQWKGDVLLTKEEESEMRAVPKKTRVRGVALRTMDKEQLERRKEIARFRGIGDTAPNVQVLGGESDVPQIVLPTTVTGKSDGSQVVQPIAFLSSLSPEVVNDVSQVNSTPKKKTKNVKEFKKQEPAKTLNTTDAANQKAAKKEVTPNLSNLEAIILSNTTNPNPKTPYKGIGVRCALVRDGEGKKVNALNIKEIFSPEIKRFIINKGEDSEIKGQNIVAIFVDGKSVAVKDIFDRPEAEAVKYVAGLFHKEGEVRFTLEGGKEVSCVNEKESVYVTSECSVAKEILKKEGVTGINLVALGKKDPKIVEQISNMQPSSVTSKRANSSQITTPDGVTRSS